MVRSDSHQAVCYLLLTFLCWVPDRRHLPKRLCHMFEKGNRQPGAVSLSLLSFNYTQSRILEPSQL